MKKLKTLLKVVWEMYMFFCIAIVTMIILSYLLGITQIKWTPGLFF